MSSTFTVSNDYGYVILAVTSTFVMSLAHTINTATKRKDCRDMNYPIPFASPEQNASSPPHMAFSCAQRAHANFLENQPTTIAALLISGLQYPRVTAALGLVWTISRYIYMVGYSDASKGPHGKGRLRGFLPSVVAQVALIGLTAVTGAQVVGFL